MPIGFILIMYLFIIRPQHKKAKMRSDMLSSLKLGDQVITSGGIIGKIRSINQNSLNIEISENTQIKVLKEFISDKLK